MPKSLPTYFHVGGDQVTVEGHQISLVKGQGVLVSDDIRYRVVDVWFSFDGHGRFNEGLHVFLKRTDDDTP